MAGRYGPLSTIAAIFESDQSACFQRFETFLSLIDSTSQKFSMNDYSFQNWKSPERMTAAERLDELAQIFAAGLIRMFAEQSSSLSAPPSQRVVDFSLRKSSVRSRKLRNRVGEY